jgi:hypothetical protein
MPLCVRVLAAFVLVFAAVPVTAAADPADREGRGVSFSTGEAGSTDQPAAEEEEPRGEDREEMIGGFCGGGVGVREVSPIDEVQALLDEGRPGMARARLGRALREGIEDWERTRAFALAGEIALRLGAATRAVAWYRQAVAAGEEPADPSARLGLSVALLRSGRRGDAARQALSLAADECAEDEGAGDPMTCYGASLVAGLAAPTAEVRTAELERARSVRTENPEYDEAFVDFHRLLPRPRLAALRIAAARAD